MSHPARANRSIATGLSVGLVFVGCSDRSVTLGWNAADGGAPPPFDGSQDAPPDVSQPLDGSEDAPPEVSPPFDGSEDAPPDVSQPLDASEDAPPADSGNATGPSCMVSGPGLTNCGSAGESCCTSLPVAGGTFYRTYSNTVNGLTEADPASVSSFRLDKYLVTVGRFRQFVAAWNGPWKPPAGSGKHAHLNQGKGLAATGGGFERGWVASDDGNVALTNLACMGLLFPPHVAASSYGTWTPSASTQENLPITCVNWYEAYAFCIWDGGFLPSEAEFVYAAAGGSEQREYPWGTTDPGVGFSYAIYGCYYPSLLGTCTGVVNLAPVGTASLGAGKWDQMDLAGNLWEWSLDWSAPYVSPCMDCANLATGTERATQGGNFNTGTSDFPPARHANNPADTGAYAYGIRCARAP
ncbi:MAG TPA: SUMF1/EgtB/PvdO family nonheme iron enzyme [Bryobacteraceae bacterium]|nr:SUMF1/EgtB/PvdO family nonheme iron enzyme [Bryobacteraceae bacterium]